MLGEGKIIVSVPRVWSGNSPRFLVQSVPEVCIFCCARQFFHLSHASFPTVFIAFFLKKNVCRAHVRYFM